MSGSFIRNRSLERQLWRGCDCLLAANSGRALERHHKADVVHSLEIRYHPDDTRCSVHRVLIERKIRCHNCPENDDCRGNETAELDVRIDLADRVAVTIRARFVQHADRIPALQCIEETLAIQILLMNCRTPFRIHKLEYHQIVHD